MSTPADQLPPDQGGDADDFDTMFDLEVDTSLDPPDLEGLDEAPPEGEPAPAPQGEVPPRHVPVAELVAERRQRQELQRRLEALEQRAAQPPAAPPAPEDPQPDYLDDPKGWAEWNSRQTQRAVQEAVAKATEALQMAQGQQQTGQLSQAVQIQEAQFVAQNPDYLDALNHSRQVRYSQLTMMHPDATPEQVVAHITQEERQLAAQLISRGRNPAEFAYNYAKTIGYQGRQQQQQAPAGFGGQPPMDRAALRGLPGGGGGLPAAPSGSNIFPEFDQAMAERFGRRR